MSITAETNKQRYEDVEEAVGIVVNMPLHSAMELYVTYGEAGLEALLNVDYTITLNEGDYSNFEFIPLESLITKIDAQIVAVPTDRNTVLLVRTLPLTTSATPASARSTKWVSDEFDRTVMKLQQLDERLSRAFLIGVHVEDDDYDLVLPEWVADYILAWHPTLKKLVSVERPADGAAATITVGSVATVAPGQPVTFVNVGTATNAVFDIEIPEGAPSDVPGPSGVGVANAAVVGDNLVITLTDATEIDAGNVRGPEGDPSTVPGPEGDSAYDVAVSNGFVGDEAAWLASLEGADGLGVPLGGADGQLLAKASAADNDTEWIDPPQSLPPGGADGQVLTKQSAADGDADWEDPAATGGGMFKGDNGTVGTGAGDIFRINAQTLNVDVTIGAAENASATGPITVAATKTLTVSAGGTLAIV